MKTFLQYICSRVRKKGQNGGVTQEESVNNGPCVISVIDVF